MQSPKLNRIAPWIIVAAGLVVYANSFSGEFVLDDVPWIVRNTRIQQLWPPWHALSGTSRPLVQFSFAVNYAFGQLDVRSYHALNLIIHILAGLTLWGVLRRALPLTMADLSSPSRSEGVALAATVLWLVHPLQTESVTYVVQRAESLMSLFALLTLYCLLRGSESRHGAKWYGLAVLCCVAGMASKSVMAVVPVLVLVFDRIYISVSFHNLWCRRKWLYAGLGSSWVFLALLIAGSRPEWDQSAGFSVAGLSSLAYAQTQPEAILRYVHLTFWPGPLCLLYDGSFDRDPCRVALTTGVVLLVIGLIAWSLRKRPRLGFWGLWFFLLLAPTSSFVPLLHPIFEHRMYLPLVGILVLVVAGGAYLLRRVCSNHRVANRAGATMVIMWAMILGVRTIARNADYRTEVSIWENTVAQAPTNPHAHYALALAYSTRGDTTGASVEFARALQLKPDWAAVHHDWGQMLHRMGDRDGARSQYLKALAADPSHATSCHDLGVLAYESGNLPDAERYFEKAVRLNPQLTQAHQNLHRVRAELAGRPHPTR